MPVHVQTLQWLGGMLSSCQNQVVSHKSQTNTQASKSLCLEAYTFFLGKLETDW